MPHGASIAGGLAFASRQADWIARERQRGLERAAPWEPGTSLWLRGRLVTIAVGDGEVRAGDEPLGRLTPSTTLREHVERSLRARAAVELVSRTVALASEHGLEISGVAIRDQRTRHTGPASFSGHEQLVQFVTVDDVKAERGSDRTDDADGRERGFEPAAKVRERAGPRQFAGNDEGMGIVPRVVPHPRELIELRFPSESHLHD